MPRCYSGLAGIPRQFISNMRGEGLQRRKAALFNKVHVWMMYYIYVGKQFIGNVTTKENPLGLLDEVTIFIVPTDAMRQRMMQIGQRMLKNANWSPQNSPMIPIAVTTFGEYEEAKSILD